MRTGTEAVKKRSATTAMQNPDEQYYEKVLQETGVEHQDITWWKYGRFETVHPLRLAVIDLQKALHELEKLLWEHKEEVGFSNGRNKDTVGIQRFAEDGWHLEVPVFTEDDWDGYRYRARADTRQVMDVTRMFFDELEWFGMLDFKLDRHAAFVSGRVLKGSI